MGEGGREKKRREKREREWGEGDWKRQIVLHRRKNGREWERGEVREESDTQVSIPTYRPLCPSLVTSHWSGTLVLAGRRY